MACARDKSNSLNRQGIDCYVCSCGQGCVVSLVFFKIIFSAIARFYQFKMGQLILVLSALDNLS